MKSLRKLLVLLVMLLVVGVSASAENESGYYLVYENFAGAPNLYSSNVPSSWDMDSASGGVSNENGCTLWDNSAEMVSRLQRKFNAEDGKLTCEFTFNTKADMLGTKVEIKDKETSVISLEVRDEGVYARSQKRDTLAVSKDKLGAVIGVKLVIDVTSGIYDLYIDGSLVGKALEFLNPCTQVDCFYVETGKEAVGNIAIGIVRVYKNLYINEKFISSTKKLPDDWKSNGNSSSFSIVKKMGDLSQDMYSLKMVDDDILNSVSVFHDVNYTSDEAWIEYQFLMPKVLREFNMSLTAGDMELFRVRSENEKLGYTNSSGEFVPCYTMIPNQWYHVMVKITNNGGELYLNHKLLQDKIKLPFMKFDNIEFKTGNAALGEVYLDDILVKDYYPYPEDYVSTPNIPKHGDYIVGMQSCSLWRDGTHFGWDWLNPFPERHSYLGFYDEGTPEAKDWEIKWMLEHGIDYELYCWFHPPGGVGQPVKYPRNGFALQDGFFNARYSNMSKFAIVWENATYNGNSKDFRENIVTYWLEQYFKDPRYLTVDNKPVISIISYSYLKNTLGGADNVAAEISYLRQACKKAGFDDCIVLTASNSSSRNTLEELKRVGFDCVYNYGWLAASYQGLDSMGRVEMQKTRLAQQRDAGGIDMMATISMGEDYSPWERDTGGWVEPDDYAKLLDWAVDSFIPSLPIDSLGKRMVMFDNWNEYGEGHFVSPTDFRGFEYVDKIRAAFAGEDTPHEDEKPTDEQKLRFSHIYNRERKLEKTYRQKSLSEAASDKQMSQDVLRRLDFSEGIGDWTVAKQVENLRVENGVLKGTSTGNDPGIYTPDNLNIPLRGVTHIRVKLRAEVNSESLEFYFITKSDMVWTQKKCFIKSYESSSDGTLTELIIETSNSDWQGMLKQVRFDPITVSGDFAIESIEFLYDKSSTPDIAIQVDGDERYPLRNPVTENGVIFMPAADFADMLDFSWGEDFLKSKIQLFMLKDGKETRVTLPYNSYFGDINGDSIVLPVSPKLIDNEAYFPLRAVCEALGYKVEWDSDTKTVNIVTTDEVVDLSSAPPDPEGTFNFNKNGDTQGWSVDSQIKNLRAKGGILSMHSTGTNPNIVQRVALDAQKYPLLNIRIKNGTIGTKFQLYFATEKSPNLKESQSVSIMMKPNSTEYAEYCVSLKNIAEWNGEITQLRIDPSDGAGSIDIDYIIFSDKMVSHTDIDKSGVNIIADGVMNSKNLVYESNELNAGYSGQYGYIGRYSLKAEKVDENGYIGIPAPMKKDTSYACSFWTMLPESGKVEAGIIAADGSHKKLAEKAINNPEIWEKMTFIFKCEEDVKNPQIYISSENEIFYLDGIVLREQ